MDDTHESRASDAAATRKRRSSILKSQRPARTPFSELEFNVATPTDTAKSRRVSFSKRTGVAEFVTNEATTTWKNFYEEHNKSLESSGNDTDVNTSRQPVEHLGRRIFDQQFEEVDAIDLIGNIGPSLDANTSIKNYTEQIVSLEATSDINITAPQNKFEFSALADQQSKLFGNNFTVTGLGEVSGHIDVNFSNIQPIGANFDLDQIERDLESASSSSVCRGPVDRHNMSEYAEIDLNMTHAAANDIDNMSITDAIDKDWMIDKENIAINPYAAPRETDNFAINEEPNQVLVFDGKRLTVQTEKSDSAFKKTLLPNALKEHPQRKTIVLNTNDDLPNFVDGVDSNADLDCKSNGSMSPVNRIDIVPKRSIMDDSTGNVSITQSLPANIIASNTTKRIVNENQEGDISMTEALPSQIITDRRRTVVYENETGNISITQMLPTNILQDNKSEKRKTIVFDDMKSNISITQAITAQVILDNKNLEKRKTIVFDENDGNISITQALPANIVLESISKENRVISVTQAASTNLGPVGKSDSTDRRRTVIYENDTGNISVTQSLPPNIILGKESEEKTQIFDAANISMTQVLPTNILIKEDGIDKGRTIVYDDNSGNISITQAISLTQLIPGFKGKDNVTTNKNIKQSTKMDTANKRRTIIYDDEGGNVSMTQAIPKNIIISDENEMIVKNTVFDDYDAADISMTQAIPTNIILTNHDEIRTTETTKRCATLINEFEDADISMTQAIPTNVLIPAPFNIIEEVGELSTSVIPERDIRKEINTETANERKSIIHDQGINSDKKESKLNKNKIIDSPSAQTVPPNVFLLSGIVTDSDEKVLTERDIEETVEKQISNHVFDNQGPITLVRQDKRQTIVLADAEGEAKMSITQAIPKIQNIIKQCNTSKTITYKTSNLSLIKPIPGELNAIQTDIFNKSLNKQLDMLGQSSGSNQINDVMVYQAVTDHSARKLNKNQQGDINSVIPTADNESSSVSSTRFGTDVTESLSSKYCSQATSMISNDNVRHIIEPKLEIYDTNNMDCVSEGEIGENIISKEDLILTVDNNSVIKNLLDMGESFERSNIHNDTVNKSEKIPEDNPDKIPEKIPENNPDKIPKNMPENNPDTIPEKIPENNPDNIPENMPENSPDKIPEKIPENNPDKIPQKIPKKIPEKIPDKIPDWTPVKIFENESSNISDSILDSKSAIMPDNISNNKPENISTLKSGSDKKSAIMPDNISTFTSEYILDNKSAIMSDNISTLKSRSDNKSAIMSDNISTLKSESDNKSAIMSDIISTLKSGSDNKSAIISDNISTLKSGSDNKSAIISDNMSTLKSGSDNKSAIISDNISTLKSGSDNKSAIISDNISTLKSGSDNKSAIMPVNISTNKSGYLTNDKYFNIPDNKSNDTSDKVSDDKSANMNDNISKNKFDITPNKSGYICVNMSNNLPNNRTPNITNNKIDKTSINKSEKTPDTLSDNISKNESVKLDNKTDNDTSKNTEKIPDNIPVKKSDNNSGNQAEQLSNESLVFFVAEDVDDAVQTDNMKSPEPVKLTDNQKIKDNRQDKQKGNKFLQLIGKIKDKVPHIKGPENVSSDDDVQEDEIPVEYNSIQEENDKKGLLDMLSNLTNKFSAAVKPAPPAVEENKSNLPESNEQKRLSFATKRQSIVISREDLLNNISMAQAALQKSKVCFDESSITDEGQESSPESSVQNISNKSSRLSSEVVKTLNFDESVSEASLRSDSLFKRTTYDESLLPKDKKGYVIPSYLKDVTEGVKELMSDLVKPMADVIPFGSYGEVRKVVSQISTQIQTNLTTSSQIDLETELTSHPSSQDNMHRSVKGAKHGILKFKESSRHTYLAGSEKTSEFEIDRAYLQSLITQAPHEQVIVFDRENPLNNVLLPLDYTPAHGYHPIHEPEVIPNLTGLSNQTLCGSDRSASCQINMEVDSSSVDTDELQYVTKEGVDREITTAHCNVSSRIPFELVRQHHVSGENKTPRIYTKSISPKLPIFSNDKAVAVCKRVESTEVNTIIAMRGNNELLESNSSLTLIEDDTSRSDTDSNSPQLRTPVRAIFNIKEQDERTKSTDSDKVESDITSIDSDMNECRARKRSHKSVTPKHNTRLEITPRPLHKIQKRRNTPSPSRRLQLTDNMTRVVAERDVEVPENRYAVDVKFEADTPKNKSPKFKHDNTISIQQLIADYKVDSGANKEILEAIKDLGANLFSAPCSSRSDVKAGSLESFTSSKNLGINVQSVATSIELSQNNSPVNDLGHTNSEWHPQLSTSSSKSLGYCDSGVNIVSKIDMLPFMGSHECERESTSGDSWSFLLLHSRIRLVIRLAHRVDNSIRTHVRADTIVTGITVETVKFDKKNPVALLCIRFARDTMRYMVETLCDATVLARDIPPLLRRCAAVSRVALRWGRAMHDAKLHLAYTLDEEGHLRLKVANIPQRSVWEVKMDIVLVLADPNQAPWPRAVNVRVERVVSDVSVSNEDIRLALRDTPKDWGHAPKTIWRMFRYLKHRPRQDELLVEK